MDVQTWTFIIVGVSFALYIGIAIWSRAGTTGEFYVAGKGVHPLANGMATGADWMSAASFISMAGIISFAGYFGSVYLMGWTGGYVLLALLLAPYLRKFGKFTVPDFVGDRYYSQTARIVAVVCAIFVSFTYVAGQMRGVGVVFSRFLEVDINLGVIIGMGIVFFYAVLGGMKGITYTQVAQYCVLIFAFMVPAVFISIMLTNNPVPQLGFVSDLGGSVGSEMAQGESVSLLSKLDGLNEELGFTAYTAPPEKWISGSGAKGYFDVFAITLALMVGTAGLPHVIIRFYTVPKVRDARMSAFWALLFIAILYTAAPAIGAFGRTNLINATNNAYYDADSAPDGAKTIPDWFKKWEGTGLLAWADKNGDGQIQYRKGDAFQGKPDFVAQADVDAGNYASLIGPSGERRLKNAPAEGDNELYIDRDIMVLANPEIAQLPNWVIALVAAGGLAAALSTAAGLLLVISTAFSHDLCKKVLTPNISEKNELWVARIAAGFGVVLAGLLGIFPPGFVAEVVALAFGLAASSFFPVIIMGIFDKKMNREGAIAGMISGIGFTALYIWYFKFGGGERADWLLGISPEGIGTVGMLINFTVSLIVSRLTPPPPKHIQDLIEDIRVPKGAGEAHEMQVPPYQQGEENHPQRKENAG
ncbi:MAG: sodium:solute symporter family protein [Phycisphaerales bacterium JB065]